MNNKNPKDVSAEMTENLQDLRHNKIKEGDIDIIAQQTGINDKLQIERVLLENNNDISKAIIALLDLEHLESMPISVLNEETTVFNQIRIILNEKEQIYHDVMNQKKQQQ
jgi:hypothetical protein